MAVVTGCYRTCVIDGLPTFARSCRPSRPRWGCHTLQFEALLTAARKSPLVFDFALVTMLGLLGLRISETCGADVAEIGEEHGRRVLRVVGNGSCWCPCLRPSVEPLVTGAGAELLNRP
jgi:integrase